MSDTDTTQARPDDTHLRWQLLNALGQDKGDGEAELYDVFDWDVDPGIDDYYASYLRSRYGGPVVEAPVNTAWRDNPEIEDEEDTDADEQTDFEKELETVANQHRIWNYCRRADILAGIGEYGILVLELSDISSPGEFKTEANAGQEGLELTGLRPFSLKSIEDIQTGGPGSGRWGEPVQYKIDLEDEDDGGPDVDDSQTGPDEMWVHHSRVIHVPSDGLLDDEVRGQPRQEGVWNALTDIEKTLGSSAEMAYRASAWGLAVNIAKDFNLEDGGDALQKNLQQWYHGLDPVLRTQGAEDIQNLGGEDIDPQPIVDANVETISARTGIPQSVLKGNETGERATTQDLKEWYGKVQERREQFVTPVIVRALIDRLMDLGVLPEPTGDDYEVEWPPLAETNEKEESVIQQNRSKTARNLQKIIPSYDGEDWKQYVEDGDFSDIDDSDASQPVQQPGQSGYSIVDRANTDQQSEQDAPADD